MKSYPVVLILVLIAGCFPDAEERAGLFKRSDDVRLTEQVPAQVDHRLITEAHTMIDYVDPVVGYEAQVPEGWRRVALDEPGDIGFTVSFESPPGYVQDSFSDYLMIEVLPGQPPEGFSMDPDERTAMFVDGMQVFRERIILDQYPVADTRMDLVAWQLKLIQPNYSVGMYIVGERFDAARLERVLIEFAYSFRLPESPFTLS